MTQFEILEFIRIKKRVCMDDVCNEFKINRANVSRNLRALRKGGLIVVEIIGKKYYAEVKENGRVNK